MYPICFVTANEPIKRDTDVGTGNFLFCQNVANYFKISLPLTIWFAVMNSTWVGRGWSHAMLDDYSEYRVRGGWEEAAGNGGGRRSALSASLCCVVSWSARCATCRQNTQLSFVLWKPLLILWIIMSPRLN